MLLSSAIKIHEGRRQGRPVPQLLLSSEENCKMVRKSGTVSAKLCSLQRIFCVQDIKYKQKVQELPAQGRKVISEVQNRSEANSDELQLPEKQTTPRGPKQFLPGRLSGGFQNTQTGKIVAGGKGIKKYAAQQWKCVLHIRS